MQAELFPDDPFKDLDWPQTWDRRNPAFDGLSEELKDVICDTRITPVMIRALKQLLSDGEYHVGAELIRRLQREVWWSKGNQESQKRFLRRIVDTGIARGVPFCSSNHGYALGDAQDLIAMALRERGLERGARAKAQACERLAARLRRV